MENNRSLINLVDAILNFNICIKEFVKEYGVDELRPNPVGCFTHSPSNGDISFSIAFADNKYVVKGGSMDYDNNQYDFEAIHANSESLSNKEQDQWWWFAEGWRVGPQFRKTSV